MEPTNVAATYQVVPIEQLKEHPLNPRKRFDQAKLVELAASVREKGVLNPLLVRPQGKGFEILAGARRFRASKIADLALLPVIVREMDDVAALELLVVDNDQREDVHALEEATGYQQLMERGKYDVAKISARIGRSVKYVYDRMKLLALTKDAQKLFLEDRFTAGHAILLARLKPEDQARAMGNIKPRDEYDGVGEGGGLFTSARGLDFGDRQPDPWDEVKPVSVRELEHWIDQHVRLEAKEADPMIFPDLVDTVAEAEDKKEKVVRITHNDMTPEELRSGPKAILGRSWKRADGKEGSKTCDHSVIGNVVIGPERGEVYRVCIAKDKCTTHWGDRVRARKKAEAAAAKGGSAGPKRDPYEEQRDPYEEQRKREEAQRQRELVEEARWKKAVPAILTALAAAVKKAPAGAKGQLAEIVLAECKPSAYGQPNVATQYVSRGTTAEDLVRLAAFTVLAGEAYGWQARAHFPKAAKAFGVDVNKILDQVAPPEKKEPEKKAAANGNGKKAAARKAPAKRSGSRAQATA